jgi:hypothetical protein
MHSHSRSSSLLPFYSLLSSHSLVSFTTGDACANRCGSLFGSHHGEVCVCVCVCVCMSTHVATLRCVTGAEQTAGAVMAPLSVDDPDVRRVKGEGGLHMFRVLFPVLHTIFSSLLIHPYPLLLTSHVFRVSRSDRHSSSTSTPLSATLWPWWSAICRRGRSMWR